MNTPKWLNDAVFYNIYPQSFNDTNNDGIGDLNGITEKLDYIKDMGFTAIWLNPIYESPFKDGGYDVTDFYKIAPRYGTEEDFRKLCAEARKRDIKVVLDLVAGHTSTECEWFKKSAMAEENEYTNRYVWDNTWQGRGDQTFITGFSDRDSSYMANYYYCQPALNYGYKKIDAPWQMPMNHPDCLKMREELLNIMEFWTDLGADGFRVDMAASLIKNDPDGEGIKELWNDIMGKFKAKHPESVMISEWSDPTIAIASDFDIDFLIHFNYMSYTSLFRHEEGTNVTKAWIGKSYFRSEGKGNIDDFLRDYLVHYNNTKGKGYISIPTGNHDLPRIALGRDTDDLKIAYTFLLTMPGVPFVYYGDEIGMKNLTGIPTKEGGYSRTAARTPMQWGEGKNFGFSESDSPYLPVDTDINAPTVENQINDENSLLNFTKKLIHLRKENKDLCADSDFEVLEAGYPLVYKRGDIVVVINPKDEAVSVKIDNAKECLETVNAELEGNILKTNGKGAAIIKLK